MRLPTYTPNSARVRLPMSYYPVFLDLSDAICLVVGAGAVGFRKIVGLLAADAAEVRVIVPDPPERPQTTDTRLTELLHDDRVRLIARPFTPDDVIACRIVFAATNDRNVNDQVTRACRERNILCSVADAPGDGTCIIPMRLARGPLQCAISTGGASPALAQRIKNELDAWLADRYDLQLALLARVRPVVLRTVGLSWDERAGLFHRLAAAPLGEALCAGDRPRCEALLRDILPSCLHDGIGALLHELV